MDIYEELIESLGIKKGDKIWLSSEVIGIVLLFRKEGVKFEADRFFDVLKDALGEEGTLLIPTFCFDFSNNGVYDYRNFSCTTGAIGNAALKRSDFIRTKHPLHSFAVWGCDQHMLCSMDNRHAFGIDSPFEYCRANNVRQIMLGTDYAHGMTFVHYAETMCNVPYRFAKSFTGEYIDSDGISKMLTFDYAARKLDVGTREEFNRIGKILEDKGIARKIDFKGITSCDVYLGDAYPVICDDILHNQCRNIYDFTVSREELFEGFGGD
jgi:aminoglycoside 3-N-acetyltransferase